jgi:hypothetical protein
VESNRLLTHDVSQAEIEKKERLGKARGEEINGLQDWAEALEKDPAEGRTTGQVPGNC